MGGAYNCAKLACGLSGAVSIVVGGTSTCTVKVNLTSKTRPDATEAAVLHSTISTTNGAAVLFNGFGLGAQVPMAPGLLTTVDNADLSGPADVESDGAGNLSIAQTESNMINWLFPRMFARMLPFTEWSLMVMAAASSGRERMDYVDVLRALAALGVVYIHGSAELLPLAGKFEASVMNFFKLQLDPGKIGVVLFFMVSGFVIPFSLKTGQKRLRGTGRFLLGRFFRLYPAYWLSILAAFAITFHLSFSRCSFARLEMNATMFQGFFGIRDMVNVYWTLQIEWIFYIACLLLFLCRRLDSPVWLFRSTLFMLLASLVLAFLRWKIHRSLPVAAPLGLSVMFTASAWRMYLMRQDGECRRTFIKCLAALLLALPAVCLLAYSFALSFEENWHRYLLCYLSAIGLFLLCTSLVKIHLRPLALVGEASFSLYLFSDFIRIEFQRFVRPDLARIISVHGYLALEMIACCIVSVLIYRLLEMPLMRMGKAIERKLYPLEQSHN